MNKIIANLMFLLFTCLIMALSIAGPEQLTKYRDKTMLEEVHAIQRVDEGEGYRYTLSPNEKVYILSESLSSQLLPESEQYAGTKDVSSVTVSGDDMEYDGLEGSFAFVVNHRGPSGAEITDSQILDTCNEGLRAFKKAGILPESVREAARTDYDGVLYSAIDVLEPRNNVAVWKLSLSNNLKNADKENRLIDAYIDADDGKIYEFYVRTSLTWEEVDPDKLLLEWSGYMGLEGGNALEIENPLVETTPYFKKYVFPGMGDKRTVVTVGFYEGINELFLKITR